MENSLVQEIFSFAIVGQPFVQELLGLLVKSSIIIGFTFVLAASISKRISNDSVHLLWLNSLLCIALLPLAGRLLASVSAKLLPFPGLTIFTVQPGAAAEMDAGVMGLNNALLALYFLVSACYLLRLVVSAIGLRRIEKMSQEVSDRKVPELASEVISRLQIARKVSLRYSDAVDSPMSFGLWRPVIVLPTAASSWTLSTLEDVLVHELTHIKRLDWPTMLFCHLLSSLFWINPLVWFARSRVNDAAEQACDSAVLSYGKNAVDYAEDLLRLARTARGNKQTPVLAQLMFDESNLTIRIRNILDGRLAGKSSRTFLLTLFGFAALSMVTFSNVNVFGASDDELEEDRDFLPLTAIAPQYPTAAAAAGIEGWALLRFTVDRYGSVVESSLIVVDAEPADTFDSVSINAARRFKFEPRIVDGQAVEVPGVQYLFRYVLDDGDYENVARPPPPARSR